MAQMVINDNQSTSPAWAGDYLNRASMMPGGAKIDASTLLASDGVAVTVSGTAAASATSVPVNALTGAIPTGTTLDFGGAKFARLTAAAVVGATSLTVAALPTGLAAADVANYKGTKKKVVASGTLVSRTYAQRDANTPFHVAIDGEDEYFLICYDVTDADANADIELYRPSRIVKENYLPNFSNLSTAQKAKVRSLYTVTRGAN